MQKLLIVYCSTTLTNARHSTSNLQDNAMEYYILSYMYIKNRANDGIAFVDVVLYILLKSRNCQGAERKYLEILIQISYLILTLQKFQFITSSRLHNYALFHGHHLCTFLYLNQNWPSSTFCTYFFARHLLMSFYLFVLSTLFCRWLFLLTMPFFVILRLELD